MTDDSALRVPVTPPLGKPEWWLRHECWYYRTHDKYRRRRDRAVKAYQKAWQAWERAGYPDVGRLRVQVAARDWWWAEEDLHPSDGVETERWPLHWPIRDHPSAGEGITPTPTFMAERDASDRARWGVEADLLIEWWEKWVRAGRPGAWEQRGEAARRFKLWLYARNKRGPRPGWYYPWLRGAGVQSGGGVEDERLTQARRDAEHMAAEAGLGDCLPTYDEG